MNQDIAKIMIDEEELDRVVTRLAGEIDRAYAGEDKHLVLLCILKGSLMFMSDLRSVRFPSVSSGVSINLYLTESALKASTR